MSPDFESPPTDGSPRSSKHHDSFASTLAQVVRSDSAGLGAQPLAPARLAELVLGELSHVMWQQRELVTHLVYRLEIQQIVLTHGQGRWIEFSTADVDDALDDVRRQETFRVELLSDLSPLMGTPPDITLAELIKHLPTPWNGIFAEHHAAFLELTAEAEEISRSNTELLHRGLGDLSDLFESLGHEAESEYMSRAGRNSSSWGGRSGSVLVDRDA